MIQLAKNALAEDTLSSIGSGPSRASNTSSRRSRASTVQRQAEGNKRLSEKEIDLALVQRVQRGDKKAFDLLVLKYQSKIGHLVSRYVHDSHESQDVTQEAFIKAYRGLKNFRGDSAFYTWLYRIAINTANKSPMWFKSLLKHYRKIYEWRLH